MHHLLERPDARIVAELADRCDGVPLFAEELCLHAEPAGSLVPVTLESVLMSRLDALDDDAVVVAEHLAVFGGEATDDVLTGLVDLDGARLRTSIERLLSQRIATADVGTTRPTYAFRHALVGAVVYDRMLGSIRRSTHQRCAGCSAGGRAPASRFVPS